MEHIWQAAQRKCSSSTRASINMDGVVTIATSLVLEDWHACDFNTCLEGVSLEASSQTEVFVILDAYRHCQLGDLHHSNHSYSRVRVRQH